MALLIIIGLVAIVGFWGISTYNFFVSSKARIAAAIQEIGNQLKRQADLIPNLEAAAKGYLTHEKEIFVALTDARKDVTAAVKSGNIQEMSDAGSKFAQLLPQIRVAVESNPEIKGTEVVTPLMDELRDTADKIMYSRRLLIDLSADYNVKRVTFPSSIVANMFKVDEIKGMVMENEADANSVSAGDMKTPKVSL